jgi:hypothetical protein
MESVDENYRMMGKEMCDQVMQEFDCKKRIREKPSSVNGKCIHKGPR